MRIGSLSYVERKTREYQSRNQGAVLGFIDDVVIRISRESDKTRVDMRSKSREGLVDGGCNAKRVQEFLKRLEGQ